MSHGLHDFSPWSIGPAALGLWQHKISHSRCLCPSHSGAVTQRETRVEPGPQCLLQGHPQNLTSPTRPRCPSSFTTSQECHGPGPGPGLHTRASGSLPSRLKLQQGKRARFFPFHKNYHGLIVISGHNSCINYHKIIQPISEILPGEREVSKQIMLLGVQGDKEQSSSLSSPKRKSKTSSTLSRNPILL